MEKMQKVIEEKIRPVLNAHNGDIEVIEVTSDGFVKVRLTGTCATCPSAQQTMSEVVEVAVKEAYPEYKGIILVHQVSPDLIHQALKILRKDRS